MEEGRLPLPNGIMHNDELWKVGDWIHIQNANDVTKPIVAQIYRTWQDTEGQKWVNACWYYRPEQTIHHYEKHFYPNEVVKTGQYRDHHVDEIIDRCFVMFFTRYSRGRPRGFPADKDVYVCEARYNEEKHKLNKIKTWASCLPDEVRDKDYEMDLFDGLRKEKKVPSPLLHMLKEDAKDTDELPKPRWGADNAPPVVGAVHKGPRDENVSTLCSKVNAAARLMTFDQHSNHHHLNLLHLPPHNLHLHPSDRLQTCLTTMYRSIESRVILTQLWRQRATYLDHFPLPFTPTMRSLATHHKRSSNTTSIQSLQLHSSSITTTSHPPHTLLRHSITIPLPHLHNQFAQIITPHLR